MRSKVRFIIPLLSVVFLFSCGSNKKLAYFQDVSDTSHVQRVLAYPYKPLKLQVDDQIAISISSTSQEAVQFFNITPTAGGYSQTAANYVVSSNGNITLPVLGDIYVIGLTTEGLKDKIQQQLKPYLKDAIVSVRLANFKVTVIGEVGRAVTIPVSGERINVLEAIGIAGDMTPLAKRYNVEVLRKNKDTMSVEHLNFTSSNTFKSSYFQLQQNDIVYVEPNNLKGFISGGTSTYLPIIAGLVSLLLVIYTYIRQ